VGETVTVTKAALVKLVDGMLNPQPLPPLWLFNPYLLPSKAGPVPDPWLSAMVARAVIDQVVAQNRLAEVIGGSERAESAIEALRSQIGEFVDEYCGTGQPRRWPLPYPFPLGVEPVAHASIDLLAAGAQFQKAADSVAEGPLQGDFSAAADRLLETGMGHLESG
jgi:hypothetical protein